MGTTPIRTACVDWRERAWKPGKVTVVCSHRPVLPALARELGLKVGKFATGAFLVAHRLADGSAGSRAIRCTVTRVGDDPGTGRWCLRVTLELTGMFLFEEPAPYRVPV